MKVRLRLILAGTISMSVGMVAIGCSGTQFWSENPLLSPLSSGIALRRPHSAPGRLHSRSPSDSDDTSAQGPLALARLSERRGHPGQAERLYSVMIEKNAKNSVPYHRLGVMRAADGKFAEAEEYFSKALRLAPSDPVLLSDVGYFCYLQRRLDEAEEFLRRAGELEPNDPAICNNLALVLGEQGHYGECLAMFKRTSAQAEAYANLAFLYAQQGEFEKAKASYSRALTLDHNLRPAAEGLLQLAQYEQLYQQPSHESAPRSDGPIAGEPRPRPEAAPQAAWPEASETYTQQASFLDHQPAIGAAVVTDSAEEAGFAQDRPATRAEAQRSANDSRTSQGDAGNWAPSGVVVPEPAHLGN